MSVSSIEGDFCPVHNLLSQVFSLMLANQAGEITMYLGSESVMNFLKLNLVLDLFFLNKKHNIPPKKESDDRKPALPKP
jgi:hypothetical protein